VGVASLGGGHVIWPSCSTSAPRTATSLWSIMKKPFLLVVKGPIEVRNLRATSDEPVD
jgi:hypothetical protein